MKVKDAMHKGVDWVSPETTVSELAKLMRAEDIGSIPIGENDRLIGMVTDRDIVCKGLAEDGFDSRSATARDVMTTGIHCCREDDDLAKAMRHMEELKIRRLPVINKSMRWSASSASATSVSRRRGNLCPNTSRGFPPTTKGRLARRIVDIRRASPMLSIEDLNRLQRAGRNVRYWPNWTASRPT